MLFVDFVVILFMIVVIGYGNDLRRDDGVGPRVAQRVAEWDLPGVECLAVPLLTVDLAEAVAGARAVLFVDAAVEGEPGQMRVRSIAPAVRGTVLGHSGSPEEILDMARTLYGGCPIAMLITVTACDLGFGEELSAAARDGMEQALDHIRHWINEELNRA